MTGIAAGGGCPTGKETQVQDIAAATLVFLYQFFSNFHSWTSNLTEVEISSIFFFICLSYTLSP